MARTKKRHVQPRVSADLCALHTQEMPFDCRWCMAFSRRHRRIHAAWNGAFSAAG